MKISVYLITHNRCDLLKRAIDSVLAQSYRNIELVIVNDASTDDTEELVSYYLTKYDNIKYFKNITSKGACFSRNLAIKNSSGDYVTGLDDDDYFKKDRIEKFVNYLELVSEKEIFLYSDYEILLSSGLHTTNHRSRVKKKDLLYANYIGNQIFIKRTILNKVQFRNDLPAWQDLDCWIRLLDGYKLQARKVEGATYVVDRSHPHERISSGKIDRVNNAYEIISLNMNDNDKAILKNQLLSYEFSSKMALKNFVRFIVHLNFRALLRLTLVTLRKNRT